ncbi:cell division protein ZapE [Rhodococcoides kyotonense]|uniref:Cell division protein ZapE n=1 Tax=Rhodococcoides kyotonense TaxID=398843 RepID=A0A239N5L4_9NOCA|nr:cell division protein ZapE [Rhodococcus kyotonensis]SNT49752.1 cell division protein ZapE [Rhodococcus kyotonensis]
MRPSAAAESFAADFLLDSTQAAAVARLTCTDELGIYMWGPVGRGKTWLLDRYFAGVDTRAKKRVHFHSFFRDLHAAYFRHGFSIDGAIDDLLGEIELLCFDEFHVHDIGDARLIARMLESLFARNVSLVVTSNYAPDELLPNPLFHDAFVPTITILKKRLREIRVDGPADYRALRTPASNFARGVWTTERPDTGIQFSELCEKPRSTADFLALVELGQDLTITDIPRLTDVDDEAVQRFSNLVDILYDRDIATTFHARVELNALGIGSAGRDIARTMSRLSELVTRK